MIEMSFDHLVNSNIEPEDGFVFIYRLLNRNDVVIYIGQTINIKSRIRTHFIDKDFVKVQIYPCKLGESTKIERDEIVRFNPQLNIELPKTDKYITMNQAKKIISNGVADSVSKYINIVFERPINKKLEPKYVSAVDVNNEIEVLIELIDKAHKKEVGNES